MTALVFPITVVGLSLIFMAANWDIIIISFKKKCYVQHFTRRKGKRKKWSPQRESKHARTVLICDILVKIGSISLENIAL